MRLEMFEIIVNTAFNAGFVLAVIYATLSIIYYTYRYAKGDNHPSITDLNLCRKDIVKLINPFYYKHPMNIFVIAMSFTGVPGGLALVWPILLPAGIIYFAVKKIRAKNLHKKKMWGTLKGS